MKLNWNNEEFLINYFSQLWKQDSLHYNLYYVLHFVTKIKFRNLFKYIDFWTLKYQIDTSHDFSWNPFIYIGIWFCHVHFIRI